MLFRVLGPLEVRTDGGPVLLGGARTRALLVALLLTPRELVPAHRLAQAVWGDGEPANVENAVHSAVSRLRRALGPAGGARRDAAAGLPARRRPRLGGRGDVRGAAAGRGRAACAATRLPRSAVLDEALGAVARAGLRRVRRRLRPRGRDPARGAAGRGARGPRGRAAPRRCAPQTRRPPHSTSPPRTHCASVPVEIAMRALAATGRTPEALDAYQRHRDHVRRRAGPGPVTGPARRARARPAGGAPGRGAQAGHAGHRLPRPPSPLVGRTERAGAARRAARRTPARDADRARRGRQDPHRPGARPPRGRGRAPGVVGRPGAGDGRAARRHRRAPRSA